MLAAMWVLLSTPIMYTQDVHMYMQVNIACRRHFHMHVWVPCC